MVVAARELPTHGYALEIDGRMKTEFQTREGARAGARELKMRFPCFESESRRGTKTREEIESTA